MILIRLFKNDSAIKTFHLPGVPRVGEKIVYGYGRDYRLFEVKSVTWWLPEFGEEGQPSANIDVEILHEGRK